MTQSKGLFATIDEVIRFLGLGLIALGVVACVAPLWSGIAVALIVGVVLLAAGTLINLFALRAREAGKGSLALVVGVVTALSGLILTLQPSAGLTVVRWILIPYMFVGGASEAAFALRLRPQEGWTSTLVSAAIAILAGLALAVGWPISGARAVGLLVGARLIAGGAAIMQARRTVQTATDRLRSIGQAIARHQP